MPDDSARTTSLTFAPAFAASALTRPIGRLTAAKLRSEEIVTLRGVDGDESCASASSASGRSEFVSAVPRDPRISGMLAARRIGHSMLWIAASTITEARSEPPLRGNSKALRSAPRVSGIRHSSA